MTTMQMMRPTVTTPPVLEPLDLPRVRKHLEIAQSDDTHDSQLLDLLRTARQQWEDDTDSAVLTQTLTLKLDCFPDSIVLPKRPIQSITSITYYDSANVSQTLASGVYSLDATNRKIYLAYGQSWPDITTRWDAVTVTYVAGYTSAALVPMVAKQAMLLLVGYYFENRDMLTNENIYDRSAYEALVRRYMRSTYP